MARREELSYEEIIDKIISKKEFKDLPRKDVELIYSKFDKENYLVEEKIKLTRDLLRKMYTAFVSEKLLNVKNKEPGWFLNKHISTKERLEHYGKVYRRCLNNLKKQLTIFDFGCGVNGFSYESFLKEGFKVKYIGTEPVGQLTDLQNNYFKEKDFDARVDKVSLFDLNSTIDLINKEKGIKVIFLFKTLDSLEMAERDYSKELLKKIVPLVDRIIISWATRSLVSKKKFYADRKWLKNFIQEEFKIIDEFEEGNENYLIFNK